ncbi:hypothetical protein BS50DRAFT_584893 [Corynespora cassiicola Philippines]|uniref:Heterokaryon incompatibility domain-containing protein n=1 Tax=Corynespora cassiicola Philippines TaxID=1448308 RepID=A0A2T2P194_CORCC|nr:hypothetical protein BS50DRAFT_584893 [Corynespora cassiicola Philippines]
MSATDTALQAPGSQRYKELQDDEIQFVILRPSLWFAAPVQLSLRTTCFSNNPVYTALSYVWGDPNVTSTVYIDGISEQATTNLVSALRHIRHPRLAQILWIDAICINRKHTKERNH